MLILTKIHVENPSGKPAISFHWTISLVQTSAGTQFFKHSFNKVVDSTHVVESPHDLIVINLNQNLFYVNLVCCPE